MQRHVTEHLLEQNLETLKPCPFIVDAGCGTGYLHTLSQKKRLGLNIVQLDIAYNMCKHAKLSNQNNFTLQADIENLPFTDQSTPSLFSSLALQWSSNLYCSLKEFHRILLPNAPFAFSTFGNNTLKELRNAFRFLDTLPHTNTFISLSEMKQTLHRAGFSHFTISEKTHTLHYPDTFALMHSLKKLGANYKHNTQKKFLGKHYFLSLDSFYRQEYGTEKGIPVSWHTLYVTGHK